MDSAHCKELEDSGLAMAREGIQTKKLKAKGQFITVQAFKCQLGIALQSLRNVEAMSFSFCCLHFDLLDLLAAV